MSLPSTRSGRPTCATRAQSTRRAGGAGPFTRARRRQRPRWRQAVRPSLSPFLCAHTPIKARTRHRQRDHHLHRHQGLARGRLVRPRRSPSPRGALSLGVRPLTSTISTAGILDKAAFTAPCSTRTSPGGGTAARRSRALSAEKKGSILPGARCRASRTSSTRSCSGRGRRTCSATASLCVDSSSALFPLLFRAESRSYRTCYDRHCSC